MPQEALIGIIYVVAAAAGILLMSKSPHGKRNCSARSLGDLLTVTPQEIGKTTALYAVIRWCISSFANNSSSSRSITITRRRVDCR